MKLAHIKDGKVIRTYHGTGRVTFENGDTVSPPTAGVHGIERLVPVVDVTVDNSKTTRTKSSTVETVEADRVLRTVTVSDMTIKDIREGMVVSRMQGVIALGESNWAKVMEFHKNSATHIQRAVIDSAVNWQRNSEDLQFIAHLIGFDDDQMDALFISAVQIEV